MSVVFIQPLRDKLIIYEVVHHPVDTIHLLVLAAGPKGYIVMYFVKSRGIRQSVHRQ